MNEMQKIYKTDKDVPEFDVTEVNELSKRARTQEYYKKAHKFVLDYLDGKIFITEKTIKWLWGIKSDLRETMESD